MGALSHGLSVSVIFDPQDTAALHLKDATGAPRSFHCVFPFSLRLRSRASTPSLAMRLRSAAESAAFLAAAPLRAMAERSDCDSVSARFCPPNLPSATAFGVFF